ncbi:MAG: DUF5680 domain-containing protein [Patescibacteria group bacterium]
MGTLFYDNMICIAPYGNQPKHHLITMTKKLINFLINAKKSTYASAQGDSKKVLADSSKEFIYSEGDLTYRDRYFGSDSFAGEEVVFSNNEAIWVMNYQGSILDKTISEKEVYGFLKKALLNVTEEMPFRGPSEFTQNDYSYKCEFEGYLELFRGTETILYKSMKIYELSFHGGIIV